MGIEEFRVVLEKLREFKIISPAIVIEESLALLGHPYKPFSKINTELIDIMKTFINTLENE